MNISVFVFPIPNWYCGQKGNQQKNLINEFFSESELNRISKNGNKARNDNNITHTIKCRGEKKRWPYETPSLVQLSSNLQAENIYPKLSSAMAPILYKLDASPPCRAVLMAAKALDQELELKNVDTVAGEQMEASFLEKNPQHTIPMLEDDDFILVDSGAIMIYLAMKNANDDNADLYPEDPQLRSLIHHRLFYNSSALNTLMGQIVRSFFEGKTSVDDKHIDKVIEAYKVLENLLGDREWMVGDTATLADLALYPTVTSLVILVPIDEEICPKLMEWITRVSELPCNEANEAGLEDLKGMHERAIAGSLVEEPAE